MTAEPSARIAVVIPARNAASFISDALESVLAQSVEIDEVFVVDDGSTDATAEIAGRAGPPVRVLSHRPAGLPAARNAGVAASTAELILFLDADDVLEPTCAEKLREVLAADPGLGMVHGGFTAVDQGRRPLHARLAGVTGDPRVAMLLPSDQLLHGGGSGTLVTRRAFEAIGGFDESMRHSEDWDFCYRLGARFRLAFVPEALFQYRLHGSSMHHDVDAMRESMLYAYGKAFREADPVIQPLRRRAYAQLHSTIAGSYLHARRPLRALNHLVRAAVMYPPQIGYALRWPQRARSRRLRSRTRE